MFFLLCFLIYSEKTQWHMILLSSTMFVVGMRLLSRRLPSLRRLHTRWFSSLVQPHWQTPHVPLNSMVRVVEGKSTSLFPRFLFL
jgi:hypothetical protein